MAIDGEDVRGAGSVLDVGEVVAGCDRDVMVRLMWDFNPQVGDVKISGVADESAG